jgi:hypothetical protein
VKLSKTSWTLIAPPHYSVQEKLGADVDLTISAKSQLDDVIERVRSTGLETLENAQLYSRQDLFKVGRYHSFIADKICSR